MAAAGEAASVAMTIEADDVIGAAAMTRAMDELAALTALLDLAGTESGESTFAALVAGPRAREADSAAAPAAAAPAATHWLAAALAEDDEAEAGPCRYVERPVGDLPPEARRGGSDDDSGAPTPAPVPVAASGMPASTAAAPAAAAAGAPADGDVEMRGASGGGTRATEAERAAIEALLVEAGLGESRTDLDAYVELLLGTQAAGRGDGAAVGAGAGVGTPSDARGPTVTVRLERGRDGRIELVVPVEAEGHRAGTSGSPAVAASAAVVKSALASLREATAAAAGAADGDGGSGSGMAAPAVRVVAEAAVGSKRSRSAYEHAGNASSGGGLAPVSADGVAARAMDALPRALAGEAGGGGGDDDDDDDGIVVDAAGRSSSASGTAVGAAHLEIDTAEALARIAEFGHAALAAQIAAPRHEPAWSAAAMGASATDGDVGMGIEGADAMAGAEPLRLFATTALRPPTA